MNHQGARSRVLPAHCPPPRRPARRWSGAGRRAAVRRSPPAAPRDTTWMAQDRVAAQLEEVVVDADPLQRRAPRPRCAASTLLHGVRGGATCSPRRRGRASGAGSAWRSTLPLGVSGRAGEDHEGGGHHVLRQLLAEARRAASRDVGGSRPSRRPGRPPGGCRPARPRAPRPPPARTRRMRGRARPRSRPARCGSRAS